MKLVSCVGWTPRGRALNNPHKVKLDTDELRQLMAGDPEVVESSDVTEDTDDHPSEVEDAADMKPPKSTGLRGSAVTSEVLESDRKRKKKSKKPDKDDENENDDDEDNSDSEKEEKHVEEGEDDGESDDDDENTKTKSALTGVAMFANPIDDPYLQDHHDSSDDDDDYKLTDTDNLMVVGKIMKADYNLVVYVYNADTQDLYVHHDYALEAPPLCLCTIGFDPDASKQYKGNLCAVGTMKEEIEIWDLDLVNGVEPVATFGGVKQSKKKRRKKESSLGASSSQPKGHSDSVLSLEWNASMEHVLASGSADNTIILWDIEAGTAANVFKQHSDKVQSLHWHPSEDVSLLSAGCDGQVVVTDCGSTEIAQKWHFEGEEMERAIWHCEDENIIVIASDAGIIRIVDRRQPDKVLHTRHQAHLDGAVSTIAMHSSWPRCLVSAGDGDQVIKIWSLDHKKPSGEDKLATVYVHQANLGDLHQVSFCPDSSQPVISACGTAGEYVSVTRLAGIAAVADEFGLSNS